MFMGIDRAAGIWISTDRSDPPNSRTSTRLRPSAESRSASTEPADPAPTTMKSNVSMSRGGTGTLPSVRCFDAAEIDVDALELRVVLDGGLAVLPAQARELGTPEGQLDRGH